MCNLNPGIDKFTVLFMQQFLIKNNNFVMTVHTQYFPDMDPMTFSFFLLKGQRFLTNYDIMVKSQADLKTITKKQFLVLETALNTIITSNGDDLILKIKMKTFCDT